MISSVQEQKSVSDTYKFVFGSVIKRAIKDVVGCSAQDRADAIRYIQSDLFLQHCEVAGYPKGLQDTLDEMVQMSQAEQMFVAAEVLHALDD